VVGRPVGRRAGRRRQTPQRRCCPLASAPRTPVDRSAGPAAFRPPRRCAAGGVRGRRCPRIALCRRSSLFDVRWLGSH
jgi:hypothetical protein